MDTQPIETDKHQVFMVSSSDKYLDELSGVINPYYDARSFSDTSQLIDELFNGLPKVLIIDATLSGTSALRFITTVRISFNSDELPIIFTVMAAQESWITEASKVTGLHCLVKPYQPSDLLDTISNQINVAIEARWDHIEPIQQQALKQTLAFFNSIADKVMSGDMVPYKDVAYACKPLIKAVENKNFQDILQHVREHDNYTYVHSMRCATFLCIFGQFIGLKGRDLQTLTTGGLLLDVGKTYIPYELLNKPSALHMDEYEIIKQHVMYGVSFLNQIEDLPKGVSIIAEQHHEKIDGTGYPYGLKGHDLNNLARMAAIVDVFCALTDRRSYRKPMGPRKALATMIGMAGHLDRRLLNYFKAMLMSSTTIH